MTFSPHIFISFKTEELEFATKLRGALVEVGFKVWWQEEIQCGHEWHGTIDKEIKMASAIIVLWSKKSMQSIWVMHEASQAISRDVYTPIRIEMIEIDSPYNRIQATDLFGWEGNKNHPGFQHLLVRLKELMPDPIPLSKQLTNFIWKEKFAFLLFFIAAGAFWLLWSQSSTLKDQVKKQDNLLSLLNSTKDSLDNQLKSISHINTLIDSNLTKTTDDIQEQLNEGALNQKQLTEIASNIEVKANNTTSSLISAVNSLNKLDSSQRTVLSNTKRALYPLDVSKMNISYKISWDIDNSQIQNYVKRLVEFANKKIKERNKEKPFKKVTTHSFNISDNLMISFHIDTTENINLHLISIKEGSSLMPDCQFFDEKMVSQTVLDHRLSVTFLKSNIPKNQPQTNSYIKFISYTNNKSESCLGKFLYNDFPTNGDCKISLLLKFEKGKLQLFDATYRTDKIKFDVSSPDLISVVDLIDTDLNIKGILFSNIRVIQVKDILINVNGESTGGIKIAEVKKLDKEKYTDFDETFKLRKEYFNSNILSHN